VLKYCIEQCYREKRKLYIIAIDFEKAFDSIERVALVKALKRYGVSREIIDVVVDMYGDDRTKVFRNGVEMGNTEVTSGIRQGCTVSAQFFIMVIEMIITGMCGSGMGYRDEKFYIPTLFYADDALMLANSMREAEDMTALMKRLSGEFGLSLNIGKSVGMIFNDKEKVERIGELKVEEKIRYLGMTVSNGRDCYREFKGERIEVMKKMANMTYSVIQKSCNKMMIGKSFWKSVVLQKVLTGSELVEWRVEDKKSMQVIENKVWRQILGAPLYAPIVALRGEVGAASVESRDRRIKLLFGRFLSNTENEMVREIFLKMREDRRKNGWMKQMMGYMKDINIDWSDLKILSKGEIKDKVNRWDLEGWRREIREKSTLAIYNVKERIEEMEDYRNDFGSVLLFRCRTNTLRLNWRRRFDGGCQECEMCGEEVEDLVHFVMVCPELENVRCRYSQVSRKNIHVVLRFKNREETEVGEVLRYLMSLWKEREKKIERLRE